MFFKFIFNWRITALQCHIGHSGGGDSGTKMLLKWFLHVEEKRITMHSYSTYIYPRKCCHDTKHRILQEYRMLIDWKASIIKYNYGFSLKENIHFKQST